MLRRLRQLLTGYFKSSPQSGEVANAPSAAPALGQDSAELKVIDCRHFCQHMLSTTQDPNVATQFAIRRHSDGRDLCGAAPEDPRTVACNLEYCLETLPLDGPLFQAEEMEDKWDIYLWDGQLYFARSWTGTLAHVAQTSFDNQRMIVSKIISADDRCCNDPDFAIRKVDYLIKSHLFGRTVPHPIPPSIKENEINLYSFSMYGRRASFAAYGDTTGS